jgi:peptidyl-prolyl cis-trans isomerase D
MLQTIRDKITGWFAIVFLGAIAIVFIFWGVNMGSDSGARYAAKVDGEGIPIETIRRAWQVQEQELQRQLRGALPEMLVKSQQQALLNYYIQNELLTQRVTKLGYRVSDSTLRDAIAAAPNWQAGGKFAPELYAGYARGQGLTTGQLDQQLRKELQTNHLQSGIRATAFVTPVELLQRQALEGETRDVDYAVIPAGSFLAGVAVTDAQIQSWYEAHHADYMTPETADLEYVELDLADVEREVAINDEVLQAYYEQVKQRLTTIERRHARHILIAVDDGVDDAAAQKTANEVLAKLKGGADFAALAKQYSKDPLSAAKGGELDWLSRGMSVGPFEDALFAMAKGELRGPVKSQFGYHIIRLDDIDGGQTKSFAEARTELEKEYRNENAKTLFYDRSQKLAEEAFKALTELGPVGAALNLPVKKVSGYTRKGGGVFGSEPKIIDAVFKDDVLLKGENSPMVPLGDDREVVVRVAAHQPPAQIPLAAVRPQIEGKLKEQAARAAAAKRGEELLTRLNGGAAWNAVTADNKLATIGKRAISRSEASVPTPVRQAAFGVPRASVMQSQPAYRGAVTEDGGFAVIAVSDVHAGTSVLGTPEAMAKARQAAQSQGAAEFQAYIGEVERGAKIERNPKVFD